MKKNLILLLVALISVVICDGCRQISEEIIPNVYRDLVLTIYTRNPADIVNSNGGEYLMILNYELFDPDTTKPLTETEYIDGNLRIGGCTLQKIGEHTYQAYLRHVLVQSRPAQLKHGVRIQDSKLPCCDPIPYGIQVDGEYDTEIRGDTYYFRVR